MTKDKRFNWRFCLCCGIFIWFVVNLLQGIFTEIHEDEAYYHLYGEHLAWGYFDHPPMVGLMTFLSSIFFPGTLGVRFFTIIASCLSLWVMWEIADQERNDAKKKEPVLFFILAFSIVMFNIYGFITTPDSSLILFSALFLLVYQRYLEQNTWSRALLMGVIMACMVYSKYHAVLFLGLIVLSNLKLLKDGKFWLACLLALALLMPHVLWQVNNDFPSFKYHLSQRSEPFRWSYFLEYLPNQLLIFNPFTFGALVYVLLRNSVQSTFERGLKFILIGFFFFFWLMAFRGHVEPHWTIVCCIPTVVLAYRRALVDDKLLRYTQRFVLPSILLIVALRIIVLTPLADRFGYHGKEARYQAIEAVAGDAPVVFRGSFQQPSLYHYFTGKSSSSLKAYYDRKTQFDLWQFDKTWTGRPVFICGHVAERSQNFEHNGISVTGYLMEHFQSPNRLVSDFNIVNRDVEEPLVLHYGDTLHITFSIYNPLAAPYVFQHEEMGTRISLLYQLADRASYCYYDDDITIEPHSTYLGSLFTIVNGQIPAGHERLMLCLGDGVSSFTTEENYIDVVIKE